MTRSLLFALLFAAGGAALAQHWSPVDTSTLMAAVTRNQQLYERSDSYMLSGTAYAFRDLRDAAAQEQQRFTVWRSAQGYRAEHFGFTTIQDGRMRVLIDPEQRIIYVSEPTDLLSMVDVDLRREVFQAATALEQCVQPDGIHFRLSFPPGTNYASLELVFDGKGWLRRMVTCWGHPVLVDPEDPRSPQVTPKMVMELGVPQPVRAPIDTDPGQVVAFAAEGARAKGMWQGYQVIDTRAR
ncbi:MAG: hypothetical protein QM724_04605 [Flavobacteriales bacterium]